MRTQPSVPFSSYIMRILLRGWGSQAGWQGIRHMGLWLCMGDTVVKDWGERPLWPYQRITDEDLHGPHAQEMLLRKMR